VQWDATHGKQLFEWDEREAADQYRLHQARVFMNRFRARVDGMRVRFMVHVHEDAEAGIEESGYTLVETIADHPGMRAQVIADITRRMESLASELRMWQLNEQEQASVFERLRAAMV
jgi:hypothetical protein